MAFSEDVSFRSQLGQRIGGYRQRQSLLEQRGAEIEAEIADVMKRLSSAEALYEMEFGEPFTDEALDTRVLELASEHPPLAFIRGPLNNLSWEQALLRTLDEAGEPLHVNNIWELLHAGGFHTTARDPKRSIVAIALRRPDLFARFAPNTYGLVSNIGSQDQVEVL